MRIVQSGTLKDFAIKPQSKRIIYFNDTAQVFMSTFLDGSVTEECRGDGVKPAHRGGSLLAALAPEPSPPLERREAPPQD